MRSVGLNVKQAVPFFMVKNIDISINFYINGLGCSMTESWVVQGKQNGDGL